MPEVPITTDHNVSTLLEPVIAEKKPSKRSAAELWRDVNLVTPFGSNIALTTAINVFLGLIGLASGPICARLLGPAGRGELAAIQNLYWLIAAISMLGMPEATLFFTARGKQQPRRILCSAITVALLSFPLFYLAVYFLIPVMLSAQRPYVATTAQLVLLGVPLYVLWMMPTFALRGRGELVRWNFARIIPPFGWLILLICARFVNGPGLRFLAFGYLVVMAISLLPTYLLARHRLSGDFKLEPVLLPAMIRYGIPLATAEIPLTLNLRLDQMLMAAFMPAGSLGIYVVAVAWSGVVLPILVAIGTVLFPRVAGAEDGARGALLAQSARLSTIAAVALALTVAVLSPVAIPLLFGQAFRGAVPVGIILAFATAISGVNIVLEEGARGLGATSIVFSAEAAGLAVTVVSLLTLLPRFGILGAGIASVLGYSGTAVILLAALKRKIKMPIRSLILPTCKDFRVLAHLILKTKNNLRQQTGQVER